MSKLTNIIARFKFVNFHGQVGARLNADQSLYDRVQRKKDTSLSYFVWLLDTILFSAPSVHIEQLHGIWVDQTINLLRWQSFIGTLRDEWNGFTIYSTVLLAVDVSFLAIPEMNQSTAIQTVTQLAVYFSTTSAMGSLIASLLLTNQSRGEALKSADQAVLHSLAAAFDLTDFHVHKLQASYMQRMANTSFGLDALGIMYSLPFGLIMWGLVFFIIALSLIVFGQGNSAPRIAAIPFCLIIAILGSWPAWYKGEKMFFWRKSRATTMSHLP
ncbi:hypothetical protein BU15DRAFT_74247 [Melanogaster broomeanus]|nr:hypothetical protein BU15DRAFT_74247 [Melanogaster broomeanus]